MRAREVWKVARPLAGGPSENLLRRAAGQELPASVSRNKDHDLTLPIVHSALQHNEEVSVFEVPLAYQKSIEPVDYEIQRVPLSRSGEQIETRLTDTELDTKLNARDCIYVSLLKQMGPLISELSRDQVGLEVVVPASPSLPQPANDRILRYERRGELLRGRGEIEEIVTYSKHYFPVTSALLGEPVLITSQLQ